MSCEYLISSMQDQGTGEDGLYVIWRLSFIFTPYLVMKMNLITLFLLYDIVPPPHFNGMNLNKIEFFVVTFVR